MYEVLLVSHIIGAAVTACAILATLVIVLRNTGAVMERLSVFLGALAAFEVATGVLLAAVSASVSVVSVCDNIALYLLVVAVAEAALYTCLRSARTAFPVGQVFLPVSGSVAMLLVGVSLGL